MSRRIHETMIGSEAANFFLRLRDPDDCSRSAAEFSEWLTRSPAHVEAFLSLVSAWTVLDLPAEGTLSSEALIAAARSQPDSDNVVTLQKASAPTLHRGATQRVWWAAAAALLISLAGWIGYSYLGSVDDYRNAGAQVRRITLADGSVVTLSPNSEIRLAWTAAERRLELRRGRARFQVAKNAQRPFLVNTALGTVRAVGTVFDVDTQQQQTRVTVIEGIVSIQGTTDAADPGFDVGSVQLAAGDHATISSEDGAGRGGRARSVMAWTAQRVVFRGATLGAVVDEFNRYRTKPVVIDDSGLATLIISGVFDPRNPDSLLTYLQLYENVQVDRAQDGSVLLSHRGGTAEDNAPTPGDPKLTLQHPQ